MTAEADRIYVFSDVVIEATCTPESGSSSLADVTIEIKGPSEIDAAVIIGPPDIQEISANKYRAVFLPTKAGPYVAFVRENGIVKASKPVRFEVYGKGF